MPEKLEIIAKPCGSATCPTLYKDGQGRLFLQGNQLNVTDKQDVALGDGEAVVEIDASLLDALRAL
ncbi:hypothetical protein [Adonisia turfae]|uniref:Uncharacterized protein n=1 Tax=Adonisia turfae CCMR0081 TaxID=2292702 RepID=A0A6M0RXV3_9CYAN|nr:hypothetical protein [Adonisia turfae]NEZ61067.1 hypothetical protein [Adonisia turfae CCMR0081]